MISKIKKFIFYKTGAKKETYIFTFVLVVLFLISSTVMAVYLLPKDDRTNFLLGTGGVTMTGVSTCYIATPTPTLLWYYDKPFVPVTPKLPLPAYPPGENQKAYAIQIDDEASFAAPRVHETGWKLGATTSYPVPPTAGLLHGTTYYWRLIVADMVNSTSDWVSAGSFTTPVNCSPINLNYLDPVTPYTSSCNQATDEWITNLTWDYYGSPDSFLVEETTALGAFIAVVGTPDGTTNQQALSIPPDTTRYYTVKAIYNLVPSDPSNIFQVDTPSVCNPRIAPINGYNCDCITITWTTAGTLGDVDHYELYRTTTGNYHGDVTNEMLNTAPIPNNQFSYDDCDIDSGSITYTYKVRTCLDAALPCTDFLDSYDNEDVVNPCQDLPIWIEGR